MKRFLALLLSLCLLLALAACGEKPGDNKDALVDGDNPLAIESPFPGEDYVEEHPAANSLDPANPIPADTGTLALTTYISETNELKLMLPDGVSVTDGEIFDYLGHLLVEDDAGEWSIRFEPFVYADTLITNLNLSEVFNDQVYKSDWSKDIPTTLAGFPARVWANNNRTYIQSMYDANHPAVDIVLDYGDAVSGPWNGLYIRLFAQNPTTETNIYELLYRRAVRAVLNNFEVIKTPEGAEYAANGFTLRFPTRYWVSGGDMLTGATRGVVPAAGITVGTVPSANGDPQAMAGLGGAEVFEKTYGGRTWYGKLIETVRKDSDGNPLPSTYTVQLYAAYSDKRCQSAYVNVQGYSPEEYRSFLDGEDMTMILSSLNQDPASWQDSSRVAENGFTALFDGTLAQYDGPGGAVEVPAEVGGVAITQVKGFMGNSDITSVVIPEGVTVILPDAFRNCGNLKSVVLPDTVLEIRNNAFAGCENLEDVTFSDSLLSMEWNVFEDCGKLKDVALPDSLTSVGARSFYGAGVGSFSGPGAVYGYSCFQKSGFDAITLGVGADISAAWMFSGAAASEINLPEGLTKLGDNAFMNCENLAELTIPATVTELGESCFANVHIGGAFKTHLPDGLAVLPRNCFQGTEMLALTVPAGVKRIECGAVGARVTFLLNPDVELEDLALATNYLYLNDVYTPEQAPQNLGNQFDFNQIFLPMDATVAETLVFDDYLLSIGKGAVTWISAAPEFYPADPENYTQNGHWVTGYVGDSEHLYLPYVGGDGYSAIWWIQDGAFAGNTAITSACLGSTDEIHSKAFDGCVNLKDIWIPGSWIANMGSERALASDSFEGLPDGVTVHLPESFTAEERQTVEQALINAGLPATVTVEYYTLRS